MGSYSDFPVVVWALVWGLSLSIVVGWFVALRRLPRPAVEAQQSDWRARPLFFPLETLDRIALGLLAVMVLCLWIGRRDIFPIPPDGYYHLLVAQNILDRGTLPLWNDWEFAPAGRPHLYPPLYHGLLAFGGWLHGGDLLAAFQDLQCLVLPFAHWCVWWLARWLFDAPRAFATLLLTGADPLLAITGMTASPSVIAGALITLMFLFYFSGHGIAAVIAGAAAFYTHTALVPMGVLGLAIGCAWTRESPRRLCYLVGGLGVLCAPWAGWMLWNRDNFHHPIALGVYGNFPALAQPFVKLAWLQLFNTGIAFAVVIGLRRSDWRDPRSRMLLACALGFLPMLLSYGGRYVAHTVHLWAIFGAMALTPLLVAPLRKRSVAACAVFALAPVMVIAGYGTVIPPGPIPMISAWWFPPIVALGGLGPMRSGEALGFFPYDDAQAACALVRERSAPGSIIHTPGMSREFALLVGFTAHRPIEMGGWEETRPDDETRQANRLYGLKDVEGSYITSKQDRIPRRLERVQVGTLYVGLPPQAP